MSILRTITMEQFLNNKIPQEKIRAEVAVPSLEPILPKNDNSVTQEFEPKFTHIQQDLLYLFNVIVTSETSLNYPWVKDELYEKLVEELRLGTPHALDYMFKEELLSKNDLKERKIVEMKPYAKTILQTFRGSRLANAKELFINSGLLTEQEVRTMLI